MEKYVYFCILIVLSGGITNCLSQETVESKNLDVVVSDADLLVIDTLHNGTKTNERDTLSEINPGQNHDYVEIDPADEDYPIDETEITANDFKRLRFGNFSGRLVSRTINITLDTEYYVRIVSENYPNPYPTIEATIYEWFIGIDQTNYGVEMVMKVFDVADDDYFIVKPGGFEQPPDTQVVFTHYLENERKFKLRHLEEMYFAFYVNQRQSNVNRGFELEFRRVGVRETTEPPITTEEPPITVTPLNRSTIYLAGKTQNEFYNISQEFKMQMAIVAEIYCLDKNIPIDENLTIFDNVNYHLITRCQLEWPNSERCVEIVYSIGVSYNNVTSEYELSERHLEDMWRNYIHLFNLTSMDLYVYVPPDSHQALITWIIVSSVIIGLFCLLILVTSRYNCFNEYPGREIMRSSIVSQKLSNSSLFPTPHQTVPPFYGMDYYSPEDDQFWAKEEDLPPKYSGGMTGQRNEGFVHDDEILDLYSEEIMMSIPENTEHKQFRMQGVPSNKGESVL